MSLQAIANNQGKTIVYCDVAIIGASTAGLYAAERLARAGSTVAVFDQQLHLAPARRTLIITPHLNHFIGSMPPDTLLHTSHLMTIASPGSQRTLAFQHPDLIIERAHCIALLEQQARAAGVHIVYGHRFRHLVPDTREALLHFSTPGNQNSIVRTRVVIGADGVFSSVATAAGISHPPIVPIIQAEIMLPNGWNPQHTHVWFDTQETRFFYWLIPESHERGVVGLVGDNRFNTTELLERFLNKHRLQPLAYQAAQVALYHPSLRPWGYVGATPVLLVGDAAGQVKVTTVGGTVTGFWGAEAAVRSILFRTPYARELRDLKRELDLHWLIRLVLDRCSNQSYDEMIAMLNPTVLRILSERNRDEMAGGFLHILLSQPDLILLGLRALLGKPVHRLAPTITST